MSDGSMLSLTGTVFKPRPDALGVVKRTRGGEIPPSIPIGGIRPFDRVSRYDDTVLHELRKACINKLAGIT